ncbi:uncharacterized protein LOC122794927 [Protopterus annectens]|uniref:uncharacterized protein LOC122794927 n=1 Tax=Protopterus annectens TaxID=7888 RepID=UPI001CFBB522|nr:uncharacterized protein LOC122794927 [Protopterus annectens]
MNKRASVVSEEDSFYDLPTEDIPESEAADAMAASSNLRYFPRRPCHPEPQYADKCCLASTTTHISVGSPALITIRQKSCLQLEKNQRESVLSTPEGSRHDQVFKKGPRSKTSHEFTPMEGHKKRLYELSNPPTVPRPPKSLPKEYHPLPAEPLVDLQPKMPPSDFEEVTVRQQVKKRPIYTKEAPNVNDEALKKESQIFRKLGKELKTHLVLSRVTQ